VAITCTTVNGSVDLNDGTNYFLQGFSWDNTRRQTWLEPRGSTHDLLAMDDPARMLIHIKLGIVCSSSTQLITKVENIRNEFIADNVIIWGIGFGSGTSRFQTRPSVIQPPDYTNSGDSVLLAMMAAQSMIPQWSFDVVADPFRANETKQPVI
jgi:hypothetical protein